MARRRKTNSEPSFDSLLDTMTNVVGILVIMLVVTLLGVRDAVQRIKWKLPDISQQELDQLRALAARKQERLRDTELDLTEVKKILAEMRDLEAKLEDMEQPREADSLQQRVLTTDKTVAELRQQLKELQQAVKQNDDEIARLQKVLASLPKENPKGSKVIRMPNPRSPPPGSTPLTFMCRYNRIVQLDQNELIEEALDRIVGSKNLLVERDGGKVVKISWEDRRTHERLSEIEGWVFPKEEMIDYFEKRDIGNRYFRVKLEVRGFNERLMAGMREGVGDSPRDLDSQLADFRKVVRDFDTDAHYARFIVYPDSFEVYVRAREMVEARDIPAGWTLYYQDDYPILSNFGLHFVGEPKPQPPKPADPAKPAKPRPKIAPSTVLD